MKIPIKFLAQKKYKDHNGSDIDASEVDCITTYDHVIDGFYTWYCTNCGAEHSSRACGWQIMGQVLVCEKCKKNNLLLYSGIDRISKAFKYSELMESEKGLIEQLEERTKKAELIASRIQANLNNIMHSVQIKMHSNLSEEIKKYSTQE